MQEITTESHVYLFMLRGIYGLNVISSIWFITFMIDILFPYLRKYESTIASRYRGMENLKD